VTTENVAILFTDVVGSTALASALTVDGADQRRREHFAILRQAVAESGGTEVKNLGDGLMVAFASTSAAVSCAVAMQQGIDRDNRGREHLVGLRVGLSVGEVTCEDDDYFGDPVIEAARLCAASEGGQILAADVVRLMAGRRSRHVYEAIGSLSLKGLPDPVDTVEVRWEPLSVPAGVPPLPARLGVRPGAGVVGREREIAELADACKRAAVDEGCEVVLVSGEAGQGKTTLVAAAARAAFDAGACVLFGHCEEDLATPYQLFAEALGHYVTHASEEQLVAHVDAFGPDLARLVPALAGRLATLPASKATDADTERYLLFAAVVGLLAAMAAQQPIVLVLDDLQWADRASLGLLRHVIASEQSRRLVVFCTYRDQELSRSHPFLETLAALRRHEGVRRIELTGLDDTGVLALMEGAAGHALGDDGVDLACALHRETDGNPFFVGEMLRHLSETGAIYQDERGRWVADARTEQPAVPDSVREVIGARIGRLGTTAERVLTVAAVIGRDFDLDVLARATHTSYDDLLDVLDAAVSAALVRETAAADGRFSFAHALVQHTLYEDLGHNRRASMHRLVAESLEDLCGARPGVRVGELARHWFHATQPVDLGKAVRYSREAADAALAALAPADALGYYAQARDLSAQTDEPDPILRLDLAIGLGTAQRQTGDAAFRDTLLDAARNAARLGDADRLVAAALANNRGWHSAAGVVDDEKVEVLQMALDRLPTGHLDRALVLAALCSELTWASTLDRRQALADEAIAIAESSGDDATVVRVLNHLAYALLAPSLLEQSLVRTADALVRAERVGDPVLRFFAAHWRVIVATLAGDIDEVDRCHVISGSLADQLDEPALRWGSLSTRAVRAQIAGDIDQAEQLTAEAFRIGTDAGEPDATLYFGLQQIQVSWLRGTLHELVPVIEQVLVDNPEVPGLPSSLAAAHVEGDDTESARHLLEDFAATDFELPPDPGWLLGMATYAEAAVECRDPRFARPLFDRLAPWGHLVATTGGGNAIGLVSHFLGGLATVLGRHDEAEAHFTRAAAFNDRVEAKFFAARTDLWWGRMLSERGSHGDADRARALLARARDVAATHGYAKVEARADDAIARLR
jgi:class 3 adenylate cyclase/tetratricopeptide (TPR) repeat protein